MFAVIPGMKDKQNEQDTLFFKFGRCDFQLLDTRYSALLYESVHEVS